MAAPHGLLYSPLKTIDRLERPCEPARCGQCSAVLNPFAHVEPQSGRWCCPVCGAWSPLPPRLAQATSMPTELKPEHATIEYALPGGGGGGGGGASEAAAAGAEVGAPASMLFVLDCSLPAEELALLEETIATTIDALPPNTPVGLITYADGVELHELGHSLGGARIWRLPVEVAQGPPSNLQAVVGLPLTDADLSPAAASSSSPATAGAAAERPQSPFGPATPDGAFMGGGGYGAPGFAPPPHQPTHPHHPQQQPPPHMMMGGGGFYPGAEMGLGGGMMPPPPGVGGAGAAVCRRHGGAGGRAVGGGGGRGVARGTAGGRVALLCAGQSV